MPFSSISLLALLAAAVVVVGLVPNLLLFVVILHDAGRHAVAPRGNCRPCGSPCRRR